MRPAAWHAGVPRRAAGLARSVPPTGVDAPRGHHRLLPPSRWALPTGPERWEPARDSGARAGTSPIPRPLLGKRTGESGGATRRAHPGTCGGDGFPILNRTGKRVEKRGIWERTWEFPREQLPELTWRGYRCLPQPCPGHGGVAREGTARLRAAPPPARSLSAFPSPSGVVEPRDRAGAGGRGGAGGGKAEGRPRGPCRVRRRTAGRGEARGGRARHRAVAGGGGRRGRAAPPARRGGPGGGGAGRCGAVRGGSGARCARQARSAAARAEGRGEES